MTARRRASLLLLVSCAALAGSSSVPLAHAESPSDRRVVLIVTSPISFEDFMKQPIPRALARAGGAGLLSAPASVRVTPDLLRRSLVAGGSTAASNGDLLLHTLRAAGIPVCVSTGADPALCRGPGLAVLAPDGFSPEGGTFVSPAPPVRSTLIIELSLEPTPRMTAAGDELLPIVMAEGNGPAGPLRPSGTPPDHGPMNALTSDTTRQPGLVAVGDVAPTILDYLGVAIPAEMTGSPIRVTSDAAPVALHRRHLEQRHIRLPIQLAELALICVAGVGVIVLLAGIGRGSRPSPRAATVWRFVVLCGAALMIPLAAGGLLPHLTYPWAVSWIVVWTVLIAAAAWFVPWRGPMSPLVFVGAVVLVFLAVDLSLGSRGLRIPLLGGTMFDGSRYYGLPNAFESMLLAGGLFVAARFDPVRGAALLFACGLLAGFPSLGADVGGSIVLFAATGLWWQLRTRGRLGLREVGVALAVTVAGLAVVLVVSRFLAASPTHATRFVEQSGSSLTAGLDEAGHRLAGGFRQVLRSPFSVLPLLGLPFALWAGLRVDALARPLAATRPWREVLIVLVLSAGVAFFVNDTGMAAAAPAFLYAIAVLAFPVLSASMRGEETVSAERAPAAAPAG